MNVFDEIKAGQTADKIQKSINLDKLGCDAKQFFAKSEIEIIEKSMTKPISEDIQKSMDLIEKAVEIGVLSEDDIQKAKYIRREGTKGNYKYIYDEPKGGGSKDLSPEEMRSNQLKKLISETTDDEAKHHLKQALENQNDALQSEHHIRAYKKRLEVMGGGDKKEAIKLADSSKGIPTHKISEETKDLIIEGVTDSISKNSMRRMLASDNYLFSLQTSQFNNDRLIIYNKGDKKISYSGGGRIADKLKGQKHNIPNLGYESEYAKNKVENH